MWSSFFPFKDESGRLFSAAAAGSLLMLLVRLSDGRGDEARDNVPLVGDRDPGEVASDGRGQRLFCRGVFVLVAAVVVVVVVVVVNPLPLCFGLRARRPSAGLCCCCCCRSLLLELRLFVVRLVVVAVVVVAGGGKVVATAAPSSFIFFFFLVVAVAGVSQPVEAAVALQSRGLQPRKVDPRVESGEGALLLVPLLLLLLPLLLLLLLLLLLPPFLAPELSCLPWPPSQIPCPASLASRT